MANYTVISNTDPRNGNTVYSVVGINGPDTGVQVAILDNRDIAIRLAQREIITENDIRRAEIEAVRANGGPQSSPAEIQTPATDTNAVPVSAIQRQPVTVAQPPNTAATPNQDPISLSSIARQPTPVGYTVAADPEGGYAVVNAEGVAVKTGLTEQQALLQAQEQEFIDEGKSPPSAQAVAEANPNLNTTNTSNLIREATEADVAEAAQAQAMLDKARSQAVVSNYRKWNGTQAGDGDWRVRLRLAPNANYLYKTPGINTAGILEPLRSTDGVIFPYTPRIDTQYNADYTPADLVHANYRSYFYKGSRVGDIIVNADFTAQDTKEADYLLAVIHFFKSCTKMFYGQDAERGSPPPLVYLSGLGQYQFNEHPCVIGQFNYNLPADVDYIRARGRQESSSGVTQGGDGLLWRRTQAKSAGPSYSLSNIWARLTGANLPKGAINYPPAPPNLGLQAPTYVPTKMSITLTLLPIQSRKQVSEQFSLKEFANGNLLKGGYW